MVEQHALLRTIYQMMLEDREVIDVTVIPSRQIIDRSIAGITCYAKQTSYSDHQTPGTGN